LSADPGPGLTAAAHAVLEGAGFELVRRSGSAEWPAGPPFSDAGTWLGERGVRRRNGTASTAVPPIVAVMLAGCILGGLDAYLLDSVWVGFLWALVAAGASGAFWLRYGRVYDSDIAMVTHPNPSFGASAGPGSASVVFWAARIRSQIHSGVRVPTIVSAPMWVAAELGVLSREFERRMSESHDAEGSRTVAS